MESCRNLRSERAGSRHRISDRRIPGIGIFRMGKLAECSIQADRPFAPAVLCEQELHDFVLNKRGIFAQRNGPVEGEQGLRPGVPRKDRVKPIITHDSGSLGIHLDGALRLFHRFIAAVQFDQRRAQMDSGFGIFRIQFHCSGKCREGFFKEIKIHQNRAARQPCEGIRGVQGDCGFAGLQRFVRDGPD